MVAHNIVPQVGQHLILELAEGVQYDTPRDHVDDAVVLHQEVLKIVQPPLQGSPPAERTVGVEGQESNVFDAETAGERVGPGGEEGVGDHGNGRGRVGSRPSEKRVVEGGEG